MFDIAVDGGCVRLSGRLDAARVDQIRRVFDAVDASCVVDFKDLDYISSAGLGVLLGAQKRLSAAGNALKLVNLNDHLREVFRLAGFDRVFEIE